MKFFVIGDLHFKASNLTEGNLLVDALINEAKKHSDIKSFIVLGDTLDNHANIHSQALNLACSFLKRLLEIGNVIVLIGNHDYINNSQHLSAEHPFNSLKYWRHEKNTIHIVDTIQSFNFGLGFHFLCCPYVPVGKFVETIKTHPTWNDASCIFAHQEFTGVGFSEKSDDWRLDWPLVVSGHIHEYLQLQSNLLYPGTPIQHSFGEQSEKTVSILEFTERTKWTEDRISLNLPRKQTIESNIDEVALLEISPNSITRLILKVTPSEWQIFRKTKTFRDLVAAKVKIIPRSTSINSVSKGYRRRVYLESLCEAIKKTGNKYMQEAFDEMQTRVA
jgi:DNA repair exonuclease SbcCD nuclease subunit